MCRLICPSVIVRRADEMLIVCIVLISCIIVFSALIVAARVDDLAGDR